MDFLTENKLLFFLSPSFAKSVVTGNQESLECLLKLIMTRKEGSNLLYASKSTLSSLVGYLRENNYRHHSEVLESAGRKFREKKQLISDLERFTYVSTYAKENCIRWNRMAFISPESLNNTQLFYPPVLLAEDLNDCNFYTKAIAQNFTENLPVSLQNLKLSDRFQQGGGGNTHHSYKYIKDRSKDFCLCIVDSDRNAPSTQVGDTAKFVMKVDIDSKSSMCEYLVVNVYSAENLLPYSEIERQYMIGKNDQQKAEFQTARLINSRSSWKFLALKKGVKGSDLKRNDARANYWSAEIEEIGGKVPCCDVDGCDCIILPKISDKTLATALAPANSGWVRTLNSEANGEVKAEYAKISTFVRSWLCVGAPMRS